MFAVPAATAFTKPVVESTVAIEQLSVLQRPPGQPQPSAVELPHATLVVPYIVDGMGFTVSVAVDLQPVLVTV